MNRRVNSGFLFLVISIVVIHNAIPHHHHEETPIHHHEITSDAKDSHANNGHRPLSCVIKALAFNLPRVHMLIALEKLLNLHCFAVTSTSLASLVKIEAPGALINVQKGEPIPEGVLICLPTRAPPC